MTYGTRPTTGVYLANWMGKYLFNHRYGASELDRWDFPQHTCNWWEDIWAWHIPTTNVNLLDCLPNECCEPNSNCMRVSSTACYRASNADYVTITTVPLSWFLLYSKDRQWTREESLADFPDLQVCAGRSCNALAGVSGSWPTLPSNFAVRLPFSGNVYTRTCLERDFEGNWQIAECIKQNYISKLMINPSTERQCRTNCDWNTESQNCVGNPRTYYKPLLYEGQCNSTINAACLQNKYSLSMPICELVGGRLESQWGRPKCINVDFMFDAGLGSIFSHRSGGNTPTPTNEMIGFKIPSSLPSFSTIGISMQDILGVQRVDGSAKQCKDGPGASYAKTAQPNTYENIANLNLEIAPITLQDRSLVLKLLRDDFSCGPCPHGYGTDDFNNRFHPSSGLARCRACVTTVEVVQNLFLPCGSRAYTKCQICPEHNYVTNKQATDTSTACEPCPKSAPYRPNPIEAAEIISNSAWRKCDKCPDITTIESWQASTPRPQMFDKQVWPMSCKPVPHLELQKNSASLQVVLNHAVDDTSSREWYQITNIDDDSRDFTTNGFKALEPGQYLMFAPGSKKHLTSQACDSASNPCGNFQYRELCGHLFDGNDMYVRSGTNSLIQKASTVTEFKLQSKYSIVREGKCKDCTQNTPGHFNGDCSSATNSPGSSTKCKTLDAAEPVPPCQPREFLEHSDVLGCEQLYARSDYTCKKCPLVWINSEPSSPYRIFIVVGCGINAPNFVRWDPRNVVVEGNDKRPKPVTCPYTSEADINKCTHRGNIHKLRKDVAALNFWSIPNENPGSDLLPYCPPGWYIDTTTNPEQCSEENLVNSDQYRPICCKQCQEQLPGFMKASNYQNCPGSTINDVQTWVPACAAGQWKDESAQVCRPCTICG